MICDICKMPLHPGAAYQRVSAWEKPASAHKGGSSLVLRERLQEWACPTCITRLRTGATPGQTQLFGAER